MSSTGNTLTLETTKGPVVIEMNPTIAPGMSRISSAWSRRVFTTASSFTASSRALWRRPAAPRAPAPAVEYPDLKAEFNAEPHVRGTVSMARAQIPNSANSQFFICFDDARFLDRQYTVWGKVVSGMENVDKIKRGEPVQDPDKIVKATLS